jgi:hypothetical protein
LKVVTPVATPSDTRWLVFAYTNEAEDLASQGELRMNGWGVAVGVNMTALPVSITYAAIPNFQGWVAISFSVAGIVRARYAFISSPIGFYLQCPPAKINPASMRCEPYLMAEPLGVGLSVLDRTLNISLPEGSVEGENVLFAFIVGIDTPEAVAEEIQWNVRVLNDDEYVVDATLALPGPPQEASMYLQNPTLSWETPPMAGEVSVVTIEVTLDRRIKGVRALLVSLPEGYRHDIQHRNQLKSMNKQFPAAIDVDWRNFPNLRWVRILVDQGVDVFLPSGTFMWKFPVMIPMMQPTATEWYFSMCINYLCQQPDDPHILVTFPVPSTEPILPGQVFGSGIRATSKTVRFTVAGAWVRLVALLLTLSSGSCWFS